MKRALPWVAAFSLFMAAAAHAQAVLSPSAEACLSCHGPLPQAASLPNAGAFPPLLTLDLEAMVSAMAAYRSGERTGTIMNRIAKGYSDEESRAIAAELAQIGLGTKP
jgi:cytochrome c553